MDNFSFASFVVALAFGLAQGAAFLAGALALMESGAEPAPAPLAGDAS